MSSSSSDANFIASLSNVMIEVNRYFGMFIFLFGMIGNIANILILSQRPLRLNPCAWLFLASSFANAIAIISGFISRFLSTWAADLTYTNQFLCKLRAFLTFTGITSGIWLIVLATIDRWLLSSPQANRRQQSTLKNAQRGTILILIISMIIEIEQIYCFEANLSNTPVRCATATVTCGIISDLFFAFVTILFPSIFMFIFGLMTILNIHKTQSRLQPMVILVNNSHNSTIDTSIQTTQRKKSDRHLLIMLLIQVFVTLLFTLPTGTYKIYSTLTRNLPKSALQNTIENLIFNLALLLVFVSCGLPFYIYTLSGGNVFRQGLFNLLKNLRNKMLCRCS